MRIKVWLCTSIEKKTLPPNVFETDNLRNHGFFFRICVFPIMKRNWGFLRKFPVYRKKLSENMNRVRVRLNVDSVVEAARKSRLRWTGHVIRMNSNTGSRDECSDGKQKVNALVHTKTQILGVCQWLPWMKQDMNEERKLCGWQGIGWLGA